MWQRELAKGHIVCLRRDHVITNKLWKVGAVNVALAAAPNRRRIRSQRHQFQDVVTPLSIVVGDEQQTLAPWPAIGIVENGEAGKVNGPAAGEVDVGLGRGGGQPLPVDVVADAVERSAQARLVTRFNPRKHNKTIRWHDTSFAVPTKVKPTNPNGRYSLRSRPVNTVKIGMHDQRMRSPGNSHIW